MPILVKTFGRLGNPAMKLIKKLAATAVAVGAAKKGDFMITALRDLSVGLYRVPMSYVLPLQP